MPLAECLFTARPPARLTGSQPFQRNVLAAGAYMSRCNRTGANSVVDLPIDDHHLHYVAEKQVTEAREASEMSENRTVPLTYDDGLEDRTESSICLLERFAPWMVVVNGADEADPLCKKGMPQRCGVTRKRAFRVNVNRAQDSFQYEFQTDVIYLKGVGRGNAQNATP